MRYSGWICWADQFDARSEGDVSEIDFSAIMPDNRWSGQSFNELVVFVLKCFDWSVHIFFRLPSMLLLTHREKANHHMINGFKKRQTFWIRWKSALNWLPTHSIHLKDFHATRSKERCTRSHKSNCHRKPLKQPNKLVNQLMSFMRSNCSKKPVNCFVCLNNWYKIQCFHLMRPF